MGRIEGPPHVKGVVEKPVVAAGEGLGESLAHCPSSSVVG